MTQIECPHWESVSAAADGELHEAARNRALDHARRCVDCSSVLATITKTASTLAAAHIALADADPARAIEPERLSARELRWLQARWTRWLLAAAAAVIVAEAIPAYATGHSLDAQAHAARHLATWQIGFGVGLLVAALMSRLSHAMLALASTFAVLTIAATVIDVVGGHRGPWAESVHLVELVAVVLLWLLTPAHLLPWRQPGHHQTATLERRGQPSLSLVLPEDPDGLEGDGDSYGGDPPIR